MTYLHCSNPITSTVFNGFNSSMNEKLLCSPIFMTLRYRSLFYSFIVFEFHVHDVSIACGGGLSSKPFSHSQFQNSQTKPALAGFHLICILFLVRKSSNVTCLLTSITCGGSFSFCAFSCMAVWFFAFSFRFFSASWNLRWM